MSSIDLPVIKQRFTVDGSALDGMKGKLGGLAKTLGKGIAAGAGIAAAGVATFVATGVKGALSVERGVREVVTLFGETGAAADAMTAELTEGVADLSNEVGLAQDAITGGLYSAISAGVPKENAFEFMRVASEASIAGVTDVETAVDGLTTTVNAFGLESSDAQAVADSMFAAVQGGKCVVGSTRVLLADGRYERIDALQDGADVVSFDGRNFVPMPAQWVDQGEKVTVRVRTQLGREIVTTWNHPYLCEDGVWRKVSELSSGDRIAVPTALPYFGERQVGEAWASLLGLWLAEGSCKTSTPRLTTSRYGDEVTGWAKEFGCAANNLERRDGAAPQYSLAAGPRGGLHRTNPIQQRLRDLGLSECDSGTKHIPAEVFTWQRRDVATLLRWMFNGDGWLVSRARNGDSGFEVGYGSKSEQLVRDLSHLLLRFGIVGTVRDRGNGFVWSARRYAEVRRFVDLIGIDRPDAGLVVEHTPKRQVAARGIVEYDPIVAIVEEGVEHVYDLMVPDLHNFVANDIVAHNTTFEELSASLFNVAPAAAGLGIPFGDVNAALATLTASGTPTSVATTQMRQALSELGKEGSVAATNFEEISGTTFPEFIASGGTLEEALVQMGEAAGGNATEMTNMFGSVEAGAAASQLGVTNAAKFGEELERQAGSAGAATEAYETMNEGSGRAIDQLKVTFQNLATEVGTEMLPTIKIAAEWLGQRLPGFVADARDAIEQFITVARNVVTWIDRWKVPILTVSGILAATYIPALIAAAVATVTQVGVKIAAWAAMRLAGIKSIASVVAGFASMVAAGVAAAASAVATAAVQVGAWVLLGAQSLLAAAKVAAAWLIAMGPIALVIAAVVALVVVIVKNWDTIKATIAAAWKWVKDKTSAAWDAVKSATSSAVAAVVGFFTDLKDRAVATVNAIKDFIVRYHPMAILWRLAREWIPKAIGQFVNLKARVVAKFGELKDGVVGKAESMLEFVRGLPARILSGLGNIGRLLYDAGRNIIAGLIDGISSKIRAVRDKISSVAQTVRDFLPFSPAKDGPLSGSGAPDRAGAKIGAMLADGIASSSSSVRAASAGLASAASVSASAQFATSGVANGAGAVGSGIGGGANIQITTHDPRAVARELDRELGYQQMAGRV